MTAPGLSELIASWLEEQRGEMPRVHSRDERE
jgi:hypothetical protein